MKVAIKQHPAQFKAKSMGDIMLDIINREQNYDLDFVEWTEKAYSIANQQVSFKTNSNREQLPVYFRQAFAVIMYGEFNNRYSMTVCGKRLAQLQKRERPYGHCTIIHYINRHKDAIQVPKANQLYMDVFKSVYNELNRQSFLKRFHNAYNH